MQNALFSYYFLHSPNSAGLLFAGPLCICLATYVTLLAFLGFERLNKNIPRQINLMLGVALFAIACGSPFLLIEARTKTIATMSALSNPAATITDAKLEPNGKMSAMLTVKIESKKTVLFGRTFDVAVAPVCIPLPSAVIEILKQENAMPVGSSFAAAKSN